LETYTESVDVEALVNQPSSSAAGGGGSTALLEAVRYNHLETLAMLLSTPAVSTGCVDGDGWGALHIACFHGGTEAMEMLLDVGDCCLAS
jgi:hypothetical protein